MKATRYRRRTLALALVLAATALALAACGGGGSQTEAPPSTAESPATTPITVESPAGPTAASTPEASDAPSTIAAKSPAESAADPPSEPQDVGDTPDDEPASGTVGSVAQELQGIAGWINTEPFSLESLRGKVVLIDFWTYTCVNCIRTFPFLREWQEKYADKGLVIVGVHSPEFEFEKVRENVVAATQQNGITWPVVQDNDFRTWRAYNNRFWPAKYLIDSEGVIRYTHFGEGAYDETELRIRELLEEIGAPVAETAANPDPGPKPDPQALARDESGQTRELYAGLRRNVQSFIPYTLQGTYFATPINTPAVYQDPGEHINQFWYLQGLWTAGLESVTHARQTENLEDYIALKFFGTSVNVVLNFEGDKPFKVRVTLDGAPFPEDQRGADIQVDDEGNTFLLVDESRMYRVVESPAYGGHELKLSSNSDRFSVFAFTFGSYAQGP